MDKEIAQISIYLKDGPSKGHEIALLHPLVDRVDSSFITTHLKKEAFYSLSWSRRLLLYAQGFIYRRAPHCIPPQRLNQEARFKTVIAELLLQDRFRTYFLDEASKRKSFLEALREVALSLGIIDFLMPAPSLNMEETCRFLTLFHGKSLYLDHFELLVQQNILSQADRNRILHEILSRVERPPITSCIEVLRKGSVHNIEVSTNYVKFDVLDVTSEGKINYQFFKNRSISGIRTKENQFQGVINQKVVYDISANRPRAIGTYSGQLATKKQLLTQLLLILHTKEIEEIHILSEKPLEVIEEKTILFTSLYSWKEMEDICLQRESIESYNGKVFALKKSDGVSYVKLRLLYHNLNAFHRLPMPAEATAFLTDLNDLSLIHLTYLGLKRLKLPLEGIEELVNRLTYLPLHIDPKQQFLERRKVILEVIDIFRERKKEWNQNLEGGGEISRLLRGLLYKKCPEGHTLKGMDELLYLNRLAYLLEIAHNKNCFNSSDRTSAAKATDKAQNGVIQTLDTPFIPGYSSKQAKKLFEVLYSMYLILEEPEINASLSTGLWGSHFFNNVFTHNPDAGRYLTRWMKKLCRS
ncbi:MAG: hypothetical protein ACKVOH_04890 [Chlamydiales bacterium]